MKQCFKFNNYPDCKKMAKFLQSVVTSPVHVQLGNAIAVSEENYQDAVFEGKMFAIENCILCTWVDYSGNELPLTLVPIVIITLKKEHTIPLYCLNSSTLHSISHFADFCESYLKRKVITQVRADETIALLIEKKHSTDEHIAITNKIKEHEVYLHTSTYAHIKFTDYFGNILPSN